MRRHPALKFHLPGNAMLIVVKNPANSFQALNYFIGKGSYLYFIDLRTELAGCSDIVLPFTLDSEQPQTINDVAIGILAKRSGEMNPARSIVGTAP
jgi:hypothetical protein